MRLLRTALAGVALTAIGLAFTAGAVGAQDVEATLSVDQVHPAGSSVHYIVELTDADGSAIDGADVTATPTSPDGTHGTTVPLTATTEGVYEGPVEMPTSGTWTVAFESTNPVASLDYTQEIPATTDTGSGEEDSSSTGIVLAVAGVFLLAVLGIVVWALVSNRGDTAATAAPAQETPSSSD